MNPKSMRVTHACVFKNKLAERQKVRSVVRPCRGIGCNPFLSRDVTASVCIVYEVVVVGKWTNQSTCSHSCHVAQFATNASLHQNQVAAFLKGAPHVDPLLLIEVGTDLRHFTHKIPDLKTSIMTMTLTQQHDVPATFGDNVDYWNRERLDEYRVLFVSEFLEEQYPCVHYLSVGELLQLIIPGRIRPIEHCGIREPA